MIDIQQSTTGTPLPFLMVLSSDHTSPATGLFPTVTLSKNCGSFGAASGSVSEIANGWYKVAGNSTDTNTLGSLILHASSTSGTDLSDFLFNIVAYNPQDATRLGLTQIPSAGTIPTVGTSANQISLNNGQVILQTGIGAGQLVFTNGIANVNLSQITGVAVDNTVAQLGSNLVKVTGTVLNSSTAQFGVNVVNIGGSPTTGTAGYVGIDWSKVNLPGSTVSLTGTTVGTINNIATSGITNNSFASPGETGVASGFIDRHDQVWRRFFGKTVKDANNIYTYADNGTTIYTTQSWTSVSGVDTVNHA